MERKKPEIGMKVRTNKKGMTGTILKINEGKKYALIALDVGYKESFFYKDLRYLKE